MSALPDSPEALIAHFTDLPDNQQSFLCRFVSASEHQRERYFSAQLAEHLHRQGENLLALTVIERCGFGR